MTELAVLVSQGNDMRHEKTVSVSKIKPLWEPWEEDETPRKYIYGIWIITWKTGDRLLWAETPVTKLL